MCCTTPRKVGEEGSSVIRFFDRRSILRDLNNAVENRLSCHHLDGKLDGTPSTDAAFSLVPLLRNLCVTRCPSAAHVIGVQDALSSQGDRVPPVQKGRCCSSLRFGPSTICIQGTGVLMNILKRQEKWIKSDICYTSCLNIRNFHDAEGCMSIWQRSFLPSPFEHPIKDVVSMWRPLRESWRVRDRSTYLGVICDTLEKSLVCNTFWLLRGSDIVSWREGEEIK